MFKTSLQTKTIKFFIPILPVSWQIGPLDGRGIRPRIAGHQGLIRFQEHFATQAKQFRPPQECFERPVTLVLNFYLPASKSRANCPDKVMYHTIKPDVTDLFKAAEDALTGIFWKDDCQVWNTGCLKFFALGSQKPGIDVEVEYS